MEGMRGLPSWYPWLAPAALVVVAGIVLVVLVLLSSF